VCSVVNLIIGLQIPGVVRFLKIAMFIDYTEGSLNAAFILVNYEQSFCYTTI